MRAAVLHEAPGDLVIEDLVGEVYADHLRSQRGGDGVDLDRHLMTSLM